MCWFLWQLSILPLLYIIIQLYYSSRMIASLLYHDYQYYYIINIIIISIVIIYYHHYIPLPLVSPMFARVPHVRSGPPRRWSGAELEVGMFMGAGDSLTRKDFLNETFQNSKI